MEQTPKILIVDDERINVKMLDWMLREAGYATESALSGTEGRMLAQSAQPDLIILDVMMPNEDGFSVCKALKLDPQTAGIPIIFLSGAADVDFKVQGLQIGAVDYITKPFAKEEVLARVKLHLKLRMADKALIQEQSARLNQIRDAQQAILVKPEDLPRAGFAVSFIPALEAGGDFYEVLRLAEKTYAYFVADVSGHDLGSSLATSSLKALIRQNSGPLYTPAETLKNVNAVLRSMFRDGKHLTLAQVVLNRLRGRISVINAGHPPPILTGPSRDELLEVEGDVLGVFEDIHLETLEVSVSPGDRIYLYTDGLIEDFAGRMGRARGIAALRQACRETLDLPLAEAVAAITDRVGQTIPRGADDVVLLGIEV